MANILPNTDIYFPGTKNLMAKLFFRSQVSSGDLKESYFCGFLPLSIFYQNVFYWEKGKPFLFNNELKEFSPAEVNCLEPKDYKELYKKILERGKILEVDYYNVPEEFTKDHAVDAMSYFLKFYDRRILTEKELEENTIDKLNPPALENVLNEAVFIENYEAALYIKNKVEARGYLIIEDGTRLKIRYKKPMVPAAP